MAKKDKDAIIADPKNLADLCKQYFKAKYKLGTSEEVKPHVVRQLRKHIARVKTAMTAAEKATKE